MSVTYAYGIQNTYQENKHSVLTLAGFRLSCPGPLRGHGGVWATCAHSGCTVPRSQGLWCYALPLWGKPVLPCAVGLAVGGLKRDFRALVARPVVSRDSAYRISYLLPMPCHIVSCGTAGLAYHARYGGAMLGGADRLAGRSAPGVSSKPACALQGPRLCAAGPLARHCA